jgi:hypothetical protein
MTTTGINPRNHCGTLILLIHRAAKPAITPPTMPPMKPALIVVAMYPATNPGAIPGRSAIANEI